MKPQSAFTLLELSIVLVIIGLIVGGITVGADMIRAAELRSVITEHQRYQTAVHVFKDKYMALPGDMTNATAFWGSMTNCDAAGPSGSGTQTCDGDGDGRIEVASSSGYTGETFTFWQHLANAGLIEGSYNGISGSGSAYDTELLSNINAPASKLGSAGWSIYYLMNSGGIHIGDGARFSGKKNNFFSFGGDYPSTHTYAEVLTPEEAWNIDKKIDDGLPSQGQVYADQWPTCTDAADKDDKTAQYLLTSTSIACALAFLDQF